MGMGNNKLVGKFVKWGRGKGDLEAIRKKIKKSWG